VFGPKGILKTLKNGNKKKVFPTQGRAHGHANWLHSRADQVRTRRMVRAPRTHGRAHLTAHDFLIFRFRA